MKNSPFPLKNPHPPTHPTNQSTKNNTKKTPTQQITKPKYNKMGDYFNLQVLICHCSMIKTLETSLDWEITILEEL